jgi:hypothetical protein
MTRELMPDGTRMTGDPTNRKRVPFGTWRSGSSDIAEKDCQERQF